MMQLGRKLDISKYSQRVAFSRRRVIGFVVIGLVGMGVLQIWAMNRLAVLGEKITQVEEAKATIMRENQLLENKVASKASLQYIQKVADNLGFDSNTNSRLKTVMPQELASSH